MKLILFILMITSAFAQDCPTVNYVTQPNSPFSNIPVADQDGVGICYAYTASQLVDYHLLKTRQTREAVMHPAWLALKSSRRLLYAGTEWQAITDLRTAGSCSYDQVEGALNLFGQRANITAQPLLAFIEAYETAIFTESNRRRTSITEEMQGRAFLEAITATADICPEGVLFDRLLPELRASNETSVQLINRIVRDACAPANLRSYNIPQPLIAELADNATAKASLEDQIGKGPFTFAYCSTTWDNPNYSMNRAATGEDCGMHSSLAVGRKQIGEHCYMLVRNTWGNGWGSWNQNEKCLCKNTTTGAWVDECTEAQHNDGNHSVEACYIGINRLSRNVQDLTTFNP
ncbi:MAG: hypothetical protein V4598_11900 [Bdellovibrionota bacterium]